MEYPFVCKILFSFLNSFQKYSYLLSTASVLDFIKLKFIHGAYIPTYIILFFPSTYSIYNFL